MGCHSQAMDITPIFKNLVKSIRTRNKACGITERDRPKKNGRTHNVFSTRAREVSNQVRDIAEFIMESKSEYVNFSGYAARESQMTDLDRDKIDKTVPHLINAARNALKELGDCISTRPQYKTHQQAVIRLLREYIQNVSDIHSEMRTARASRAQNTKKMSRLDTFVKKANTENTTYSEKPIVSTWTPMDDDVAEESLSPEELQMFRKENQNLYSELNSLMDEYRQIEGTVATIAELQSTLTEKVLEQDHDIETIAQSVMGTTENIKDANEQLRAAIQRNASCRAYVLFFILTLSFSLLFLNWFN